MSDSFCHGRLRSGCWSSSAAEAADVVAERNPTASEFEGQRCRLSMPIAPSSFTYFCINSIVIDERAPKPGVPLDSDIT